MHLLIHGEVLTIENTLTNAQSTVGMEIIIVGAGIAGLSTGIGLRRAGHKVTVNSPLPSDSDAHL